MILINWTEVTMSDLQYIVAQLRDCNKAAVAKSANVSARTVRDIANGRNTSPSYNTVRKLADYFRGKA